MYDRERNYARNMEAEQINRSSVCGEKCVDVCVSDYMSLALITDMDFSVIIAVFFQPKQDFFVSGNYALNIL